MKLFDRKTDCGILLEENCDVAISLAARDLQENLRRLSGKDDGFLINSENEGQTHIRIQTSWSGVRESYTVGILPDGVLICGSDVLGTVYGIYAFCTRCLKISPSYRFTDLFPETREAVELEEAEFNSPERNVRFRGWFLNDEDLLTDFKLSGGKRDIDYRFYGNVMDVSVLELVLETALRLEMNLIIPSSFVDIENPWEEKLIEATCRRGLYISQHHVEPLGVSYFAADHYIKKYGSEGEIVSFISNRRRMEEIWDHYVRRWAKYGDRVIWQLGLRGKADTAVWSSDPTCPVSMEQRGKIITDAIQTQYQTIRRVLGHENFQSTVTLWHEGSLLYGNGHLVPPKKSILIFSDFGVDQTFGEDFYNTLREADREYGIYYHAAYFPSGAHLAEVVNPLKMEYFYREAKKKNSLTYSILNVSNVRPLHFILEQNSNLLSDLEGYDARKSVAEFDRFMFGEEGKNVTHLRWQFYDSFADFGEELVRELCRLWLFFYRDHPPFRFVRNPAGDGQLVRQTKQALLGKWSLQPYLPALKKSEEKWDLLDREMTKFSSRLADGQKDYFETFLHFQTKYLLNLTRWSLACADLCDETLSRDERKAAGERGLSALNQIEKDRWVESRGFWSHWHRGDLKINLDDLKERTNQYLNKNLEK